MSEVSNLNRLFDEHNETFRRVQSDVTELN